MFHWDYYAEPGPAAASPSEGAALLRVQSLADIGLGFADSEHQGMCLLLEPNEK